jgi:hypothetical protein
VSTHLFLEAAARSLAMGAIILVALRLMRIEQVRARRTAWLLALTGALAMPILVSAQIGPRMLPDLTTLETLTPRAQAIASLFAPPVAQDPPVRSVYGDYRGSRAISRAGMMPETPAPNSAPAIQDRGDGGSFAEAAMSLAVFGYCVVAAVLSLRLCAGVGFALRLRNQAERVIFPFDPELDVRTSSRVASPVTIGSSVLLPRNYTTWDPVTLRIVLSHERAHVRQRDFLIQALAGLHCALFWFNPFSWWLQRQLAELGEALSDCAAVEQAESRTSYAEILLAFAARPRWPLTAVAMASASNLTPRIERLLNDQGFERSFAKAQRLPFIAAGVVALAMFASTSMVRVHAATTDVTPPSTPVTPSAPAAQATLASPAPTAPAAPPAIKPVRVKKPANTRSNIDEGDRDSVIEHDDAAEDEEGILVINSGHSRIMFDSGGHWPSQSGDYIYFQHNGRPYLIQDPQIIAKAQALLAPTKELREQQRALGEQQRQLGARQRVLGSQQRAIELTDTPEFKRQVAELQRTIKELDLPRLTAQINQKALAEVQSHLGEIEARVGELQTEFGAEMGKFGEEHGRLGEQQGKLGEQQARLGEQQRQIMEDVRRQLQPIIEQAIRDGRGQLLVK